MTQPEQEAPEPPVLARRVAQGVDLGLEARPFGLVGRAFELVLQRPEGRSPLRARIDDARHQAQYRSSLG